MDEMCRFRLIEREDLAFLVAGMNLPEVMERTLTAQPITEEELYVYTYRSKRDFWRCIELNGAVVGICAIYGIIDGEGHLAITVFEEKNRHKGIGTQALYYLLGEARDMKLHTLYAEMGSFQSFNGIYERAGFSLYKKIEGGCVFCKKSYDLLTYWKHLT